MTARRVTVVGGGLAGITAALDAAAAGARVTLLEVRPRLGGAAYSFRREGLALDNGQHVFLRCCTAYRALLGRLGASASTYLQPRLDIPVLVPGGRGARLWRTGLPAPLHLAAALARYTPVPWLERVRAVQAMQALRAVDPTDPANDAQSFGDWLARRRQGPHALEALWRLITVPTINLEPDATSLAQAAHVFRAGLLERNDAGDVGWSLVPLGDLHDGPAQRALAAAGVDVRLGSRVRTVAPVPAGGFTVGLADGELAADAVVVALPSQRAGAVLPPGALEDPEAPTRLGTSPIVNLHVAYDRPVMDRPFAVAVASPVSWVFDRTQSAGLERGQLLALSVSAADAETAMDAETLRARFLPALAELFPAARAARVEQFVVTREVDATFRAAPGQLALRPGPQTRIPGLVLAGSWTATGWPATMESAVRSGHAAADALARRPAAA